MKPLHISMMKKNNCVFSGLLFAFIVVGCGNSAPFILHDTDTDLKVDGHADTDTDTTGDTDTDSDIDVDTDSDADFDSDSEIYSSDPWVWMDNPEGEDCGQGCRRLTFQDRLQEMQWDVWDDKLVYSDFWWRIFVVDIPNQKTLQIPDVYSEFVSKPDGTSDSRGLHPTIYQQTIFYSLGISSRPYRHEMVHVDLDTSTQRVIFRREDPNSEYFLPEELDLYGERLVTSGSTGDPTNRALGYHESPWIGEGHVIIDRSYGGLNSLWGDTLVFWELDGIRENITGYDFKTGKLFAVTDDDEYQFTPRIHKRKVVYMDLRMGESDTRGNWEHGAIFMKDLDSGKVEQITDGAALASYPDIYDDIIVWMDWRNCPSPNDKHDLSAIEIWGYNLASGKMFQITNLPEYQKGFPRIWKDKVYVQMFKDNKNGVYQFELPDEAK